MKELKIITFVDGEDDPRPVRELWEDVDGNIDPYVKERLEKIEKEGVSYQPLKEIYDFFNSVEETDSPFELAEETDESVTIHWTDEDWNAKFILG